MANGISQALFPPEVGLCISLPGLILVRLIKRRVVELDAFLAQLESYTVQYMRSRSGLPFVPSSGPVGRSGPRSGIREDGAGLMLTKEAVTP
jgi:hypothetical protein